jgi:hypothetical protein
MGLRFDQVLSQLRAIGDGAQVDLRRECGYRYFAKGA